MDRWTGKETDRWEMRSRDSPGAGEPAVTMKTSLPTNSSTKDVLGFIVKPVRLTGSVIL